MRFFPESRFAHAVAKAENENTTNQQRKPSTLQGNNDSLDPDNKQTRLSELANQFAESIPADEFSTAELQGYLLMCKMKPLDAASGIVEWIEQERADKREREEREEKRKEKMRESKLRAKAAMVADLVGPLQQQAQSSSSASVAPSPSGPPTPAQAVRPDTQSETDLTLVCSTKINGVVKTLDP